MRRFLIANVALTASIAVHAQAGAPIESACTEFDARACSHTAGEDAKDYGTWRCPSYQGISVWLHAGDRRVNLSFGPAGADEPAAGETIAHFNDAYNGKIDCARLPLRCGYARASGEAG